MTIPSTPWRTRISNQLTESGPDEPGLLGNPDYAGTIKSEWMRRSISIVTRAFTGHLRATDRFWAIRGGLRDTAWSATWRAADRRVKLMMLPEKDREIIVADGPSLMNFTPYLLARERGDKPSQFVSVIDIGPGEFRVKRIEALPIVRQPDGAFKPVAMAVTLDEENGVQDIFLSGISGPFEARRDDASYATDAQLAFVRWSGDELTGIHVTLGSFVRGGRFSLDGFPAAYQGQVVDIDYDQGSLLIAPEGEWSFALADQYVLITAPEYPVNSAYRIRQAEKEGDYVRLQLFPTSLELGRGYVPTEPKDDLIPNMTNLPYTGLIYRVTPNDRFQGKEVVNEKGARTVIKQVEGAAGFGR